MGGLARKATVVDNIRAKGYDVSVLDAGNLFFAKDNLSPGVTTDVAKVNAETILKAFNEIGCDAFSPGSQDFALGIEYLRSLEKKANFPFISSNIFGVNGEKLFNSYIINNKNGINIGYIGLASQFKNQDVSISDPISTLYKIVDEISQNCELIVLLFNGIDEDILKIQNSNIPIDLIIRSKSKRGTRDGGNKRVPVYSAANKGKKLYQLDVSLMSSGESIVDVTALENKLVTVNQRLDRMKTDNVNSLSELYQKYINDKNITNRLKGYEKQINEATLSLNSATNTISLIIHELNKNIADKPSILKIVDSGKEEILKIAGPDYKPAVPYHDHDHHHGHRH